MNNRFLNSKPAKSALLYIVSALFVAASLYLLLNKDTMLGFAIPVVVGILLLYIFRLDVVLFMVALVTPLSINLDLFDSGMTLSLPSEPLLIGIMLLFVAKLIYERNYDLRIASHPVSYVIYIMFFWMIVTTITSDMPLVSVKFIISRLWFIIPSYFMGAMLFRNTKNIDRFIWLYAGALLVVVAYTTVNHAMNGFSGNSAHWVMTPFYNDHTAYGAIIAIFLILSAMYLFIPNMKRNKRILVVLTTAVMIAALILSFCRAALLSIIGAIAVLICIKLKIKFRWIAATVVIVGGLFFAFQQQIFDSLSRNKQDASGNFVENIQSISNISTDASNLERINRWSSALRMFKERPVFGWGPGTYQFEYAPFQMSNEKTIISTNAGDMGNAHSEYIGPLAEQGLVGMLIMLTLVGMVVYTGITTYLRAKSKECKVITLGCTLAMIGYFIHGMLNNFLDTDKLAVPVWSCIAIIVVMDVYHSHKDTYYEEIEK